MHLPPVQGCVAAFIHWSVALHVRMRSQPRHVQNSPTCLHISAPQASLSRFEKAALRSQPLETVMGTPPACWLGLLLLDSACFGSWWHNCTVCCCWHVLSSLLALPVTLLTCSEVTVSVHICCEAGCDSRTQGFDTLVHCKLRDAKAQIGVPAGQHTSRLMRLYGSD